MAESCTGCGLIAITPAGNRIQPGPRRVARESRDRASADAVPALRERAVRNGLPRQRDCSQRGRSQRHGLQPLHRHTILLEQLPLQSASIQFLRLQSATGRQEKSRRRVKHLRRIFRAAHNQRRTRHDQDAEKSKRYRADARCDGEMHVLRATHRGSKDRGARAPALRRRRRIPRDSFTSACAQACPTEAIVFGDIKDPESRVSKMKQQDRNYRILDYLNVVATSQLSRAHSQSKPENA